MKHYLLIIILSFSTLLSMNKEKKVEMLKNAAHEAKLNILVPLALKLTTPTYRFPKDICITLKSLSIIQEDETVSDEGIIKAILSNEQDAQSILKDLAKDS